MTAQNGALVLIKASNGASPEVFTTIGGLRTSDMVINHRSMRSTNIESGAWQQLLAGSGIFSCYISGSGLFTNSASEEIVRAQAFSGTVANYIFAFANGSYVTGPFTITSYERAGNYDSEEMFTLTLESAGNITFSNS